MKDHKNLKSTINFYLDKKDLFDAVRNKNSIHKQEVI